MKTGDRVPLRPHPRRPAFHPAAAALHRSGAGQGAGGIRHRPAVDLRLDHPDAAVPQVRRDGKPQLPPDRRRPRGVEFPVSGHFTRYVDYDFTAKLEDELDAVVARRGRVGAADGDASGARSRSWSTTRPNRSTAAEATGARELGTDPKTGKPVSVRLGRYGPYAADRHHRRGRSREADVRVPASRPEHAHDLAGRRAGAVQAAAQARHRQRTRKSASASAASARSPSAAACMPR